MRASSLIENEITDLTSIVKVVWERSCKQDTDPNHQAGYSRLYEHAWAKLGEDLRYIYVRGTKPVPAAA